MTRQEIVALIQQHAGIGRIKTEADLQRWIRTKGRVNVQAPAQVGQLDDPPAATGGATPGIGGNGKIEIHTEFLATSPIHTLNVNREEQILSDPVVAFTLEQSAQLIWSGVATMETVSYSSADQGTLLEAFFVADLVNTDTGEKSPFRASLGQTNRNGPQDFSLQTLGQVFHLHPGNYALRTSLWATFNDGDSISVRAHNVRLTATLILPADNA